MVPGRQTQPVGLVRWAWPLLAVQRKCPISVNGACLVGARLTAACFA